MQSVDPAYGGTGALDRAAAARAAAFGRAERHSKRVRWLKFAVPVAAVLMTGAFVYASVGRQPDVGPAPEAADSSFEDGKLVMANPKLEGFTSEGKPYSMTALRALQSAEDQGVINLENIDAKMPMEGENWARVEARNGVYNRDANTLGLTDGILVTAANGMTARLAAADIDIGVGTLLSNQPVEIQSRGAKILADSMRMADNGKLVTFEKRVRVTIDPAKARASDQASGETDASN